jgi:GNAT superfamily N-acetyltransferase
MITATKTNETLMVKNTPRIPGLTFRRFRGEEDFTKMIALLEACRLVDKLDWVTSLEDLVVHFNNLVNCNPNKDILLAEVDEELIYYSQLRWRKQIDGKYIYRMGWSLHPKWRRSGIAKASLHWNENRIREIATKHPVAAPKYFRCGCTETEVEDIALLEKNGYQPTRYFFAMHRPIDTPLPEAPMPKGIKVRPVKPEQIDAILDANDEAFHDHWGHTPMTEQDRNHLVEHPSTDISLWKVAWDGDQVAGMVLNFVDQNENKEFNRKRGYTEDICVRRPWRKQGLARSLLVQSVQMFKEMGFEETALGVDTHNLSGALNLYEDVGYSPYRKFISFQKPLR